MLGMHGDCEARVTEAEVAFSKTPQTLAFSNNAQTEANKYAFYGVKKKEILGYCCSLYRAACSIHPLLLSWYIFGKVVYQKLRNSS